MVNSTKSWTPQRAGHLLARAGFGGSPQEVQAAFQAGPNKTVERLLSVEPDDDLFPCADSFSDKTKYVELFKEIAAAKKDPVASEAARKRARQAEQQALFDLRAWWLRRLRYSPNPLREKITLFWHGHFATSVVKVRNVGFLWRQNELFRAHALGDFRALAREIPTDPAMMRYLDVAGSSKSKPNENFARELMELFLLGEGNYSEEDIRESARAFTGYRINPMTQEMDFQERRSDTGVKTFFGQTGAFTATDIVDIILSRPQCANFLTAKMWKFFAGTEISPAMQSRLAAKFRDSGYDISPVLQEIFLSEEFYSEDVMNAQIKSPVDWLVGSSKRLESPLAGNRPEQNALRELGQSLFEPPNVKGWEGGRSWISASTFLMRCNLSSSLVIPSAKLGNLFPAETRSDAVTLCDAVSVRLLNRPCRDREKILAYLENQPFPASDKTVADVLRLLMNSPDFQLT